VTSTADHRSGIIAVRLVRWFAWCCLIELLATWIAIDVLGDRVWWTVMLLFGPRWVLGLPWFGVVPWLLAEFRRAVLPALAGAALVLFGLIGFHVGLHRASVASGIPFRVLELNADGGVGDAHAAEIFAEIRDRNPDLVVIAECGDRLGPALRQLSGYHVPATYWRLCMLSRDSIISWEQRSQTDVWKQGGAGYIVRAVVSTPAGPLRVGLVHLATPRHALDSYFTLHTLPEQGPNTRANMAQRDEESGLARSWILQGPTLPTIVVGDFNLPAESAIYRRYWGDLRNAFGRAGFGTGNTKIQRLWGVRIDHVLTSDDIGTSRSFVGRDVGSDHLPLIADLVLPRLAH
jgi:endonuclease/exonuclease/phosphatase (EEP) superfamily protein YafD